MLTGKRKGKTGKIAAWLTVFVMAAGMMGVAGCGETKGISGEGGQSKTQEDPGESTDNEKVMGRYLEQADDSLAEELNVRSRVVRMEDGSLFLMSGNTGKWVSVDNGASWEREEMAWFEEWKAAGRWIMDMNVAGDGRIAVIYAEDEDGEADAGEEEDTDGKEDGGTELHMKDFSVHPKYAIVAPDGTVTELEIPSKDSDYINKFVFSGDNRLFGSALDGRVYEIDKNTGTAEEVMELSHTAAYMTEKDGRLILANRDGVTILDLASGEIVEDKALDDFLQEQFGPEIDYSRAGAQPLLLLPGEEGIIYLVLDKGIYRHVIGGNVMEQAVDGSLTSLGNPFYGLSDGVILEDDVFLLVFTNGEIMRYTYDPDIPAMPEIRLKAYSLRENAQIKTVISAYQVKHPEVYIQYEAGIDESLAVTREDALKKLNTEIAAGRGPDIFILDDMPIDSFIEKGVLMDLSPYLEDKTEDKYFTNVIHAFRTPEGTYAVPGQFHMALMVGRRDEIEKMTGLEAMAAMAEAFRKEKGEGLFLGAREEEEILSILLPVCAPAWKDGEGKIDRAALEEFYTMAKRIWDAEKAGVDEEQKESYEEWLEEMKALGMTEDEMREYQFSVSSKITEYLSGRQKFVAGAISDSLDLDIMVSCFRIKGKTDSDFAVYNGQEEKVFLPDGLVGISASCQHPAIAAGLLEDILNGNGWDGMPVSKEKFREKFLINATVDGGSYGAMGIESEDGGTYLTLDIYPATEEEIAHLMELAAEGRTPYVKDSVLENAVCLAGVKALRGELDAAAAVEEVIQKTAIYMSE